MNPTPVLPSIHQLFGVSIQEQPQKQVHVFAQGMILSEANGDAETKHMFPWTIPFFHPQLQVNQQQHQQQHQQHQQYHPSFRGFTPQETYPSVLTESHHATSHLSFSDATLNLHNKTLNDIDDRQLTKDTFATASPSCPSARNHELQYHHYVHRASGGSTFEHPTLLSFSISDKHDPTQQSEPVNQRVSFMSDLYSFMASRGSPIDKVPTLAHRELDLFRLYSEVIARGGYRRVIACKLWCQITNALCLPPKRTDAATRLREHYTKYLAAYEEAHFVPPIEIHIHDPKQHQNSSPKSPSSESTISAHSDTPKKSTISSAHPSAKTRRVAQGPDASALVVEQVPQCCEAHVECDLVDSMKESAKQSTKRTAVKRSLVKEDSEGKEWNQSHDSVIPKRSLSKQTTSIVSSNS